MAKYREKNPSKEIITEHKDNTNKNRNMSLKIPENLKSGKASLFTAL
jgi:hypothetical protein